MAGVDFLIVGGGLVGCAIAYGLGRAGRRVLVLDGTDGDIRASRANYGIVWVQGKGRGFPAYQRWTRRSAEVWPSFAAELEDESGVPLDFEQTGGLTFCLGNAEYDLRRAEVAAMDRELPASKSWTQLLDRVELQRMLQGVALGRCVSGAVFCPRDGHVNPLFLLCALKTAIIRRGGVIIAAAAVRQVVRDGDGFVVTSEAGPYSADRLIIAAGVATPSLARQVGLDVPVRPQRGQILVTERLAPILPMPTVPIRQTAEGTVLIGSSQEEVGLDTGATAAVAKRMATRAVGILPGLRNATLVRQWGGLRVISPDVAPIYVESESHPGAWALTCHSGVTLAAAHAVYLAPAIDSEATPPDVAPFHSRRFDVPQAA